MTATASDAIPSTATRSAQSLPARVVGVVFAPRVTYTESVRNPRVFGALVAISIIAATLNYAFMSTDVGRMALIDQQFTRMVDPDGLPGMLMGSIDFFRIWWIVNLSIGLGVLYEKRTSPVAWSLLAFYLIVVLIVAGVRAAL